MKFVWLLLLLLYGPNSLRMSNQFYFCVFLSFVFSLVCKINHVNFYLFLERNWGVALFKKKCFMVRKFSFPISYRLFVGIRNESIFHKRDELKLICNIFKIFQGHMFEKSVESEGYGNY